MKKEFVIRIDLESKKGIEEGLPKLLDLFKEEKVAGSFYIVMGGESNILEILRNRGKMSSSQERKIKLWSFSDKARMILFPQNFTRRNLKSLRRILSEGHELGLHGWKHREWTRGLNRIPLAKRFDKMVRLYNYYFSSQPTSWASPGFNLNKKVLSELEKRGIVHISDFEERKSLGGITNIPITLLGKGRTPFIEYWVSQGKNDDEILEIFKKEIRNKRFVSFYLHGMFEGRFKIGLLRKMIRILKKNKFKSRRVVDIK